MRKNKKLYISGTVLMAAVMASNVINFVYSALLGRMVTVEDFGIIIFITNILYVLNIFLNALAGTVNHKVAALHALKKNEESDHFVSYTSQLIFKTSLAVAVIWLLLSAQIASFFHIDTIIIILFTPLFIFYPYASIARGFFQGKFSFFKSTVLILLEPLSKLASVLILLYYQQHTVAYTSVYLSAVLTGIVSIVLIYRTFSTTKSSQFRFPRKFFAGAVIAGCSTISFLALDVILVKHYLSPTSAGQYSLLSLIGKIIYFLGTLFNMFTISIASQEIGVIQKKFVPFYYLLIGALISSGAGYVVFGVFGFYVNPLIFGKKVLAILPYLNLYLISMLLITIGSMLITYHLAKKEYWFSTAGFITSAFVVAGIIFFHANLEQIVNVFFYSSVLYFAVLSVMHVRQNFFVTMRLESDVIARRVTDEAIS